MGIARGQVLQPGDLIVAIDGQPVTQAGTVGEVIRSKPAGSEFRFTIERDGRRMGATGPQPGPPRAVGRARDRHRRPIPWPPGRPALLLPGCATTRTSGGRRAGLIYALVIADVLSAQDHAGGRPVAATGTIDSDGDVGPAGGVKEEAIAVRADADVYLVPRSEVDQAHRPGLRVVGVERLQQAIAALPAAA